MAELAGRINQQERDGPKPFQLSSVSETGCDATAAEKEAGRGKFPATPTPGRRRRKLGWLAAILILAVVAAGAWWLGSSSQSPDQAAARAREPEPSWITVPVEFRVLSSTLVVRGDVRPEARTEITSPTSVEGVPIVTQDVVVAGDAVHGGDRVIEVSGWPVFVMQGDTSV